MSQLQLLLGVPEVKHSEHILTFPDRKALTLLAYHPLARGSTTLTFWWYKTRDE